MPLLKRHFYSSFLRSAWECNCAGKGYHAERGSQVIVSSFLRSAWECNCASKGYHAERGSQVKRILLSLIPRSYAQRGNATVPARATRQSVGARCLQCLSILNKMPLMEAAFLLAAVQSIRSGQ